MKKIIVIVLLGISVMLLWVCQKSYDKKNVVVHGHETHQTEKNSAASTALHPRSLQRRVMAKPTSMIPAPYHAVSGLLQHTILVGTADHPTINGGLLNAPGIPVNQEAASLMLPPNPIAPPHIEKAVQLSLPHPSSHSPFSNAPAFQDHWATSQRVGQLLREAIQHDQLKWVLQKADAMGLPANVAVVPMIESDYQNNAVSNKGAAGAWQLMPATAKQYGLNTQQRFEFHRATCAALQLLKDLHHTFDNWELAYAAYHAGTTRVKRALAKTPHARRLEDLDLPIATKNFVNRVRSVNQTLIRMANNGV